MCVFIYIYIERERERERSRKVAGSISDAVWCFNWRNPSSGTVVLVSTKPVTEMSSKNRSGFRDGRPESKADNLTTICEPIV
jgi:hypothetical protein